MTSPRGKRAVVVGGGSGVGEATVKALISEGARVTAVARGADRLRAALFKDVKERHALKLVHAEPLKSGNDPLLARHTGFALRGSWRLCRS